MKCASRPWNTRYLLNKLLLTHTHEQIVSAKCQISLQEYQSKKLLEENGLNIQHFHVASTPEQAVAAGKSLSE